ncbi:hypothetical protein BO82DRAFT_172306 [Aspergillus uvarum CBS 121591]|uniref:Uncharacterized protein n=1 Tax=Aspergillus uvarum CBS 121591 TaxID=1448315 RepID=A0A319CGS0_9EURO|nr:hypothetical protein BO82DRAFT_172306 [Aspergillus uvarum CBS 121591]PYH77803.1 hypothetical protein BO82DRAFT_172306 [Aspergillus uvarum CBS 121591]
MYVCTLHYRCNGAGNNVLTICHVVIFIYAVMRAAAAASAPCPGAVLGVVLADITAPSSHSWRSSFPGAAFISSARDVAPLLSSGSFGVSSMPFSPSQTIASITLRSSSVF